MLGAHMSIAGGFHQAVQRAADAGCDCVQLFTTPPRMWPKRAGKKSGGGIREEDCKRFQQSLAACHIQAPIVHASYLINLASPDRSLWQRSIDAMVVELLRASELGIPYVIVHPGSFTTSSESAGIRRIIQALDELHRQLGPIGSCCLLETTAGQGSNLGHRFEHLAEIISAVQDPERLGVCFDTCHVFAAGYAMETRREYLKTMRELKATVGIGQVKAFHLNDSQCPLGSRRDRHAHIGKGCMGLAPFEHLLNDRRFRRVPMYLETPKGNQGKRSWDQINLGTLRHLCRK